MKFIRMMTWNQTVVTILCVLVCHTNIRQSNVAMKRYIDRIAFDNVDYHNDFTFDMNNVLNMIKRDDNQANRLHMHPFRLLFRIHTPLLPPDYRDYCPYYDVTSSLLLYLWRHFLIRLCAENIPERWLGFCLFLLIEILLDRITLVLDLDGVRLPYFTYDDL